MHFTLIKFFIALKNATALKKELVYCFYNKIFLKVTRFLYVEGLIKDFSIEKVKNQYQIIISLKYSYSIGALASLKIVSKPSWPLYLSFNDICKLSEKNLVFFFSTSKGLMNSIECKKYKIGGKLLVYVK
jgi:ribosomal protein S8